MLEYVLFAIGFILLIKGADLLVDGSSAIARLFRIKELVIGLTIVSFGTSAPELVVNLVASFNESPELAIGNVLGSNIANIFLILGISALIHPLMVQSNTTYKEIPFQLLAAIIVFVLGYDVLFSSGNFFGISRGDGLVLLGFFIIFMYYVFSIAKSSDQEDVSAPKLSQTRSVVYILLGMVGLSLGSHWIVKSAIQIAQNFDVSERLIGLSLVAIGTSLPELAASVVAAMKRNTDLAIGNVVGSNIFNIFWIFGISATIHPIVVVSENQIDFILNILASLLLFGVLFVGKKQMIEKWQGVLFLIIYSVYIGYLIYQG